MEIWLESINFKSRRFLSSIFRFVDQKCYKNYSIQFYKWESLDRALFCYKAHTEKAWAQNKYRDKQVWHS